MKRRDMVKATVGVAAAAGISAVAVVNIPTAQERSGGSADGGGKDHVETYKGRTIRVAQASGAPESVYIDERPLHVMKLGENAYMSSMCHYALEESPLVAARRAVDELRGAQLLAPKASGSAGAHRHSA
ncbi:tyrosinase family oxidase copper chaperone [Streptomyces sp. H27-D2]|uniref:tyrosinase family oxidase copper chaperone n=1 Tax=Streptomyces sp. H27-D2 TaxID=3046304 RepID=UPI002DB567A8|nr:tyrosinase family oxidase copper chaperone [Streptomyces sp. H27-D2]MEC4019658.1 tyrosinase family oxidase copper chaperone [Streptomyces sp. H27-D2]